MGVSSYRQRKPHPPEAKMSSKRAKAKTTKKRPQRATSNVFAMFDQSQIQEFKEAFNMIDQNRDGFIDKEDLHDMLASMGKNPTDEYLEGMMSEAPGPINFTMFLTMFGEKLNGTDPEDVIRNAFACFDEEASDARPQQPTSIKASHILSSPVGPAHCLHFRPSQKPNCSRPFWPTRFHPRGPPSGAAHHHG
uniref:Myosin light chain 9 n=1 Tax=Ursus maritimus TaxID=29073 RepID=A0A452TBC2_URSMA